MTEPVRKRRRGQNSRQLMHARRAAPPIVNPAPPGSVGGQYKPLTDAQMDQILATAFRMLEELGMGDAPARVSETGLVQRRNDQ